MRVIDSDGAKVPMPAGSKQGPTPGPWQTHSNIGKKGELGVIADAAPCIICVMGNQQVWPLEADANAALIANAPWYALLLKAVLKGWGVHLTLDGTKRVGIYMPSGEGWEVPEDVDTLPACPDAETYEKIRQAVEGE